MPCTAISRDNLKVVGPCGKPTFTIANGVDVSAESLCLFHWEMKNGLLPVDAYQAAILGDGPVGWWRLNEPAGASALADSSGNGNVAAPAAPVTLGVPALARGSSAALLGLVGSINIPDKPVLNFTVGSWEAWFKASTFSLTDFDYRTILLKGNQYWIRVDRNPPPNYTVFLYLWNGSGYIGVNSNFTSTYVLPGTTYHVVGTYDGANLRLYINGALVGTTANVLTIPPAGTLLGWGQTTWDGVLDEVAVYNKALSPAQILAHYQMGV